MAGFFKKLMSKIKPGGVLSKLAGKIPIVGKFLSKGVDVASKIAEWLPDKLGRKGTASKAAVKDSLIGIMPGDEYAVLGKVPVIESGLKSNTFLYVGIGAAVLVVLFLIIRRK